MLAGYNLDAMNAVVLSGTLVCAFTLIPVGIAGVAEIYVGQYNGAQEYHKLAAPVWQMLYFSGYSILFFLPAAYFSEFLNLLPAYYFQEGVDYQRFLLYFGFLPSVIVSLSSFFIGQGRANIVTVVVLMGFLVNVVLDYLLIYGYKDSLPSMGVRGAAIATILAEIAQVGVLALVFFNKENRTFYKTFKNRQYDKSLFLGCIKIGIPLSASNLAVMFSWYLVQCLVSHVSKEMATIYGIGLTIYMLFAFVGEGLNKAMATLSANMIGQKDLPSIQKTFRMFIAFSFILGGLIAIPLLGYPEKILAFFDLLKNTEVGEQEIRMTFSLLTIGIILEALTFSLWGILVSGGDARYPTIVYQTCLWSCLVLPTALLYIIGQLNSVTIVYEMNIVCLFLSFFFLYRRYKSLVWFHKII
jgi:MATE family multidrug resistance protein